MFSEGASATRSVASSAPAGTAVGQPVRATDADAGDDGGPTTLEGTDAASFSINCCERPASHEIAGVTLDASTKATYSVDGACDSDSEGRKRDDCGNDHRDRQQPPRVP